MSKLSSVLFFSWSVLFVADIWLPLAQGECTSNFDCRSNYWNTICCYRSCSRTSCIGEFCLTDGDCGGKDECCSSYRCTTYGCSECSYNYNCGSSEYCCKHQFHNDHNVCRRSCVGETCHWSGDCGGPKEYCSLSKICRRSTVPSVRSCTVDSDCTGYGECCSSYICVSAGCTCSSNSDCTSSSYCCGRGNFTSACYTSCVGEYCMNDGDCGGPREYCSLSKKCYRSTVTVPSVRSCTVDSDCTGYGECCSSYTCVSAGCTCSSNSDCTSSSYCCGRGNLTSACQTSCVGEYCINDGDCGGFDESCNTNTMKCKKTYKSLPGWAIAVIVVGVILVIFACSASSWRCFRGRSQRGVVVRQRPAQRTTAIIALRETEIRTVSPPPQAPAPVYNHPPPSYYNQGQDVYPHPNHQLPPQTKQWIPEPHHMPQPQPLHFPSP